MLYTVQRIDHETRALSVLGSYTDENAARECFVDSILAAYRQDYGIVEKDIRIQVQSASQQDHYDYRKPTGERDGWFYIERE